MGEVKGRGLFSLAAQPRLASLGIFHKMLAALSQLQFSCFCGSLLDSLWLATLLLLLAGLKSPRASKVKGNSVAALNVD